MTPLSRPRRMTNSPPFGIIARTMKEFQQNLVAAWRDYAAGRIDAKALKAVSAGFGIYEQRDGKAMMRIRRDVED